MSMNPKTIALSDEKSVTLKILENLFLILTGVYLLYAMKGMTMFKPMIPDFFVPNLKLVMEILVLALVALRQIERPGIWLGLILVFTYAKTSQSLEASKPLFTAILVMGLAGIDYRRILRTHIAAVGGGLAATVIAGLGGGITNLVYNLDYIRSALRSCWGTAYPTDFSSLVLFLAMSVWMAWPELPDWMMLALGLIPLALAQFITASRTSLMCGVLFELFICYHWLERGALTRVDPKKRIQRVADALLMAALPMCALLFFLLVFLYIRNPQAMERVDNLLSFRLQFSARALREYPVMPFGTVIDINVGSGGTVFSKGEMFFLDSSYMSLFMRYGWVTMLAMFGMWEWQLHRALRCGNRRMALVMAVIAVHSIMEHHFADVFHNILLVMPLALISADVWKQREPVEAKKRNMAFGTAIVTLLALGMLFLPKILSVLRTVYDAQGWQGGGAKAWPVLGLNLAIVFLVVAGVWAVFRLILLTLSREKRGAGITAGILAACLAIGFGMSLWSNGVIARAVQENEEMVDADSEVLSCLSEFDIYADVMPEVYRRRFANVRQTVLGGDDLARISDAVVLMDSRPEHRILIGCGFKFLEISDAHVLYISDPKAEAALRSKGYAVSDYYDKVIQVDLQKLAKKNKLEWSDGGVLLNGSKKSLTKGLGDDLFLGSYAAQYCLYLPEEASDAKGKVCELRVSNETMGKITSVVVNREQFDAQGCAKITVPFTLQAGALNVRFQVIAQKNRQVGVSGISYWQTRD